MAENNQTDGVNVMNYNRMTIREVGGVFQVFKLKTDHSYAGSVAGGGFRKTSFFVSPAAKPVFSGNHAACMGFISKNDAVFMSEHGLPV